MAASSPVGRVLTLCRRFQNVCTLSSAIGTQKCAINLTKYQDNLNRNKSLQAFSSCSTFFSPLVQHRSVHTTISRRGLEEFFDSPENWGESTVKSGAPWAAKQLRAKSNEDLHKLWYRFKEYAIPWYLNKRYKRKKFFTPLFVEPHVRLRIEKSLREKTRKAHQEKQSLLKLKEKFPKSLSA
ncbi:39S ribosomal protein L47, mitochondrial [Oryzias melastigma]|uniref:Large ribosomal subunit protein uL29m n=1 Tax=Oryzias melastigma TaxID=30732 RepID=A0A834BP86_ORYME|nr:39S ribosomal protein L47, mitochondrial [Oryzias melastigma]